MAAPVITSDGGGTTAELYVTETTVHVTTVAATIDAGTLSFSIAGADASFFTINSTTGVIEYITAPIYGPGEDADGDNRYEITVTASDGLGGTDTQALTVNLCGVMIAVNGADYENGYYSGQYEVSVTEGVTRYVVQVQAVAVPFYDIDAVTYYRTPEPVTDYALNGSFDWTKFTLNAVTGDLRFIDWPDYEAPTDSDLDNIYLASVSCSKYGRSGSAIVWATVLDGSDVIPTSETVITSNGGGASASISIAENTTFVTTVSATDYETGTISYALSGVDVGLFSIGAASGVVEFLSAPDFELPADSDLDNVYLITATATSSKGGVDTQNLIITVTDATEAPVSVPHQGTNWTVVVTLNGVDVSDKITANARVEAEEKTSRIASFFYRPAAGSISAGDWLGVAVTIDYKTVNGSGTTLAQNRIFTGTVDQAIYDPITQLTAFDCTDDMQGKLEAMTQVEIDALIASSRHSVAVFGEYKNGWLYFENVMATYPQSFDYNVDGVTGTLADWAAKVTPDFTFDNSTIVEDSISYSIAPRRDLFNSYTIDYSYRFTRLHHRSHQFDWGLKFCPYFARPHELPTKDMVRSAVTSAGWTVIGQINLESLIPAAADPCNDGVAWSISEADRDLLALGAHWKASKRWDQEITEHYTLTINAPQSVTWLGDVGYSEQASNQTDFDASGWSDGNKTPAGRINSLGDVVQDKYDRTLSNNDIETLIARARTEILESHRANHVVATVLLVPTIERFHTVRLDADGVTGQGKVFKYVHDMDFDSGEAYTTIDVAISLNGGAVSAGDSAIAAPSAPDTDPISTAPSTSTLLETHIGGDDTLPDYDELWDGFAGNYSLTFGAPTPEQFYTRRFKVVTPAINQDSIDHAEAEKIQAYSFDIPNETLIITVS